MRLRLFLLTVLAFMGLTLISLPAQSAAQQQQEAGLAGSGTANAAEMYSTSRQSGPEVAATVDLPEAPQPQSVAGQSSSKETQVTPNAGGQTPAAQDDLLPQPKRILGMMPNYRAVSAGVKAPPPTTREAYGVATEQSFDYSAFIFVGITSLMAKGDDSHPSLGKGVSGYWAYYWRGFLDKTDGNYWVYAILPVPLHEDERYYAMGTGGIWKRGWYAATRILITPNYQGRNTFNAAEIMGRGVSQAISLAYYPDQQGVMTDFTAKFGYAIGRDALANVFREFWPDIDKHVLHHHRHRSVSASDSSPDASSDSSSSTHSGSSPS